MTARRRFPLWPVTGLIAIAPAGLLVPGSPIDPSVLLGGAYFDGRDARYWMATLSSGDAAGRCKAIRALGVFGRDTPGVVPALCTVLGEDSKRGNRIEASLALMRLGPAARPAVPALARALRDPEPQVRMNAVLALLGLGPEARPAVPALMAVYRDRSNQKNLGTFAFNIREMAVIAVGRASAGSAEAVPVLAAALEDAQTLQMRLAAARALGEVGAKARPAAPLLRELLKDENADLRQTAEEALRKIEGESTALS